MSYAPENLEASRDMARKSFVLLKNEKQTLPLQRNRRITVIGELAVTARDLLGSWQAAGDASKATTILDAITAQAGPQATVVYEEGCKVDGDEPERFCQSRSYGQKCGCYCFCNG